MHEIEYQQVIAELQAVIDETQHTLDRFEATGMNGADAGGLRGAIGDSG